MIGRPLGADELGAYDLVDPATAARVRVVRVPVLPPGASGMTLGRWVLLLSDADRRGGRTLLAHELVHVEQFRRHGTIRFLLRYLGQYLRALRRLRSHRTAYRSMPLELEARARADQWRARHAARTGRARM
jgi:hypothetical protein